ncbi:forkhead-associated protein [Tolypothrix tenuis PCC 7101]|uniref:Forkhead-associated protein n=1 Tax=Tolypothrix tenuis PCC 7101 TaxID=231146 RepID=A0A1Z4N865_9CYAN|nr:FHA domain-containing protein [Aulosira sp. FACHB-113]BAZ01910.1 forkhead-associated protein [Tolypothrix tenuis PCC 7101]BAZ74165.1 forkhead-associated protein [Aulosira laxa NIES-50]
MKIKVNYSPTADEVNELDLALATAATGECMIGRSPDSYLVLNSPDVSRVHGKFFAHNGNYYFCDLGSRNGSVINGKLAQKNVPVQLKDKDIIRIGDYVMTVEDIIPTPQQLPATVFKTIDPSLLAGWRVNDNIGNINIANPAKVNSKVAHNLSSESAAEFSNDKSELETSELESEIKALENIIENSLAANEFSASVSDVNADVAQSVSEEITFVQLQGLMSPLPEIGNEISAEVNDVDVAAPFLEEITFVQPQDLNDSIPETASEIPAEINGDAETPRELTIVQPRAQVEPLAETLNEVVSDIDDDFFDLEMPILQDFTDVQPRAQVEPPAATLNEVVSDIDDDFFDLEMPILQDFTDVQPRDKFRQPAEMVSELPTEIADLDIDWDAEIPRELTIVQPRHLSNQPQNIVIEVPPHISDEVIEEDFKVKIDGVAAPKFVDGFTPEFSHEEAIFSDEMLIESGALFCQVPEPINNQAEDIKTDDAVVVNEEAFLTEVPEATSELSESDALSALLNEELEDDFSPELTLLTSESINQLFAEIYDSSEAESSEIYEEVTVIQTQPEITHKNIVLLAHENKKAELAEFVHQHQEFFSHHHIIAWQSISEVLHEQAGVTISHQIPAATSHGYQAINTLVNSGDISAVIFLRDFLIPQTSQANEEALLRSCNINKVLLATNVPTAEALVYYLKSLKQ